MQDTLFRHPDLHMHSRFSDGTDTPAEILAAARAAGLDIFSLTDHDTCDGCSLIRRDLKPGDPAFLNGIEFSCCDEHGRYHILGYGFREGASPVQHIAGITHKARLEKAENRFRYLAALGYTFRQEDIDDVMGRPNPGRPQFAGLLVHYGYMPDLNHAYALLADYPETEYKPRPEEAIARIRDSGGVAVLAHGFFEDGNSLLTDAQMAKRAARLAGDGLEGLEVFYSRYTPAQQAFMLALSRKHHLLATAGSDYHGGNKAVRPGQTGSPEPSVMAPFYETIHDRLVL